MENGQQAVRVGARDACNGMHHSAAVTPVQLASGA